MNSINIKEVSEKLRRVMEYMVSQVVYIYDDNN